MKKDLQNSQKASKTNLNPKSQNVPQLLKSEINPCQNPLQTYNSEIKSELGNRFGKIKSETFNFVKVSSPELSVSKKKRIIK